MVEQDAYWIPPSRIEEARLVQILAEMIEYFLTLEEKKKEACEVQATEEAPRKELRSA